MQLSKVISFLDLQFLSWKRSKFFSYNVVDSAVNFFILTSFLAALTAIGIYIAKVHENYSVNYGTVILYYLMTEFSTKVIFQRIQLQRMLKPLLRLGFARSDAVNLLIGGTLLNKYNLMFLVWLPLAITRDGGDLVFQLTGIFLMVMSLLTSYVAICIQLIEWIVFGGYFVLKFVVLAMVAFFWYSVMNEEIGQSFFSMLSANWSFSLGICTLLIILFHSLSGIIVTWRFQRIVR